MIIDQTPPDPIYIICPKTRSLSRKNIDVCAQCKDRAECDEYQKYIQPELFNDNQIDSVIPKTS
jgi:hypothetical protein